MLQRTFRFPYVASAQDNKIEINRTGLAIFTEYTHLLSYDKWNIPFSSDFFGGVLVSRTSRERPSVPQNW